VLLAGAVATWRRGDVRPLGELRPATRHLRAIAAVTATATATLCQFDPDLRGLSVQQITVDGRPASWHRRGQELII